MNIQITAIHNKPKFVINTILCFWESLKNASEYMSGDNFDFISLIAQIWWLFLWRPRSNTSLLPKNYLWNKKAHFWNLGSFVHLFIHLFNFILGLFSEHVLCTSNYIQYVKKCLNPIPKTWIKAQPSNRNKSLITTVINASKVDIKRIYSGGILNVSKAGAQQLKLICFLGQLLWWTGIWIETWRMNTKYLGEKKMTIPSK